MNAPFAPTRDARAGLPDGLVEVVRDAVRLPAGARIVAAMSGGVDSTVTAALLAKAGYDVVGVTLQLYDHGAAVQKKGACCAGQDIHDARTAAEGLGIPHYVLDYESRFKQQVIEDFADSYLRGETPIPCIRCNQTVKFRRPAGRRPRPGRRGHGDGAPMCAARSDPAGPELHRAFDPARDQSLLPVRHHRRAARLSALPAGRPAEAGGARGGGVARPGRGGTSRTARTSASCRRAATPRSSTACARTALRRATSCTWTAARWAGTKASPATPSASAAG